MENIRLMLNVLCVWATLLLLPDHLDDEWTLRVTNHTLTLSQTHSTGGRFTFFPLMFSFTAYIVCVYIADVSGHVWIMTLYMQICKSQTLTSAAKNCLDLKTIEDPSCRICLLNRLQTICLLCARPNWLLLFIYFHFHFHLMMPHKQKKHIQSEEKRKHYWLIYYVVFFGYTWSLAIVSLLYIRVGTPIQRRRLCKETLRKINKVKMGTTRRMPLKTKERPTPIRIKHGIGLYTLYTHNCMYI